MTKRFFNFLFLFFVITISSISLVHAVRLKIENIDVPEEISLKVRRELVISISGIPNKREHYNGMTIHETLPDIGKTKIIEDLPAAKKYDFTLFIMSEWSVVSLFGACQIHTIESDDILKLIASFDEGQGRGSEIVTCKVTKSK